MTTWVIAAILACVGFAVAGPYLARVLPPATAVRLIVPAMALAAGCAVFVLGTVAFTWLGQLAGVAAYGEWSPQSLSALDPIPRAAAASAGGLLLAVVGWWLITATRTVLVLRSTLRTCRRLIAEAARPDVVAAALRTAPERGDSMKPHPDASPANSTMETADPGVLTHSRAVLAPSMVVVDSDRMVAFTTPAVDGRIVVSTGLLAALNPDQRRALLAHERSHLRHRHPWWALAADQAAAICPLLRPTAAAVRHAVERWADEDAARRTGRRLLAETIATVALLRVRGSAGPVAAATGGLVPARVRALLRPAPRLRVRHLGLLVVVTTAVLTTALAVERAGELLFEHAEPAAAGTSPPVALAIGAGQPAADRDASGPLAARQSVVRSPEIAWKARS